MAAWQGRCRGWVCGAAWLLCAAARPGAPALAAEVSDADVDAAMEKGVRYVLSQQQDDGTWSAPFYDRTYPGGVTALATWTLLTARTSLHDRKLVRLDDPRLVGAIESLKRQDMEMLYSRSLRLMVWCSLDWERYRRYRNEDAAWLVRKQHSSGGWGYPGSPSRRDNPQWLDNSNSQFAVLALGEAAAAESPVPAACFKRAEHYWLEMQTDEGGWGYVSAPVLDAMLGGSERWRLGSYGSMTAAGLASLYLIDDALYRQEQGQYTGLGTPRCGRASPISQPIRQAIDNALRWLGDNFQAYPMPGDQANLSASWTGYYHYSVERVGRASGRKYLGTHDWYREIAEFLVAHQRPDGSWGTLDQTCFAVISLVKGRAPVTFNKLQYEGDWNNYRRDVATLTTWMSRTFEYPMTWQIVNLSESAQDILDAPVLYFNGLQGPEFDAAARQVIQDYVWSGGTVVAEACNGSPRFVESVRQQFRQMFPRLQEQPLPPDHPLWSCNFRIEKPLAIMGYSDACRTRLFLIQRDVAGAWHQDLTRNWPQHFQLGANLYLYATDVQPIRMRLRPVFARQPVPFREAIRVGRIQHQGRWWWASPTAASHLSDALASRAQIGVTEQSPVRLGEDDLSPYKLLWMTGHEDPALTPPQQEALKQYLLGGGTLMADAHCGSAAFDAGFRKLVESMFGAAALVRLAPTHPLITGQLPGVAGHDVSQVEYSRAGRFQFGTLRSPQLLAVMLDGRAALIYTPVDVIGGVTGQPTYGRVGYTPDSARNIAVNVLLYASGVGPSTAPSSQPATTQAERSAPDP